MVAIACTSDIPRLYAKPLINSTLSAFLILLTSDR